MARLQSPDGAIVGISYSPVLHDQDWLEKATTTVKFPKRASAVARNALRRPPPARTLGSPVRSSGPRSAAATDVEIVMIAVFMTAR
jgi:hypothetical protein